MTQPARSIRLLAAAFAIGAALAGAAPPAVPPAGERAAEASGRRQGPLFLHAGWASPPLELLREHVDELEAEAPFDGLLLNMGVTEVMYPKKIHYDEAVRRRVKLYRRIRFKRFRHNFCCVLIDQARPDWFSDKYWKIVAENFGVAAEVVEKAGMDGICFDPECYGIYPVTSYWTSSYFLTSTKQNVPDTRHTAEQYLEVARRRGRQVGAEMFRKCPTLKFFSFYLWSMKADLLGAFSNGILDVMPPSAALIDGDEWNGYCANSEACYRRIVAAHENGYGMLDPALAARHAAQGQVAVSFYMDPYLDPTSTLYKWQPRKDYEGDPVKLFARNLSYAKEASGDYIWIYGEKGQWWDFSQYGGKNKYPLWEARMPGAKAALFGDRLADAPAKPAKARGKSR